MGEGFCCAGAVKQAARNKEISAAERRILKIFKGTPVKRIRMTSPSAFWNLYHGKE
jgi:hypothetical protein